MSLPKSLSYQNIKPRGFASSFKRWTVNPQQAYNQQWSVNEQVRFVFQTKDFIDPYQSYIEIEVEFDPNDYKSFTGFNYQNDPRNRTPNDDRPSFQLDGPATSLLSELIIYSNNKEIERITEYDQIGNLLADLNVKLQCRMLKAFEGYHYDRMPQSKSNFLGEGQGLTSDSRSGCSMDLQNDVVVMKGSQPFKGIKPFYGVMANGINGPVLNAGNLIYSGFQVPANINGADLYNTQIMHPVGNYSLWEKDQTVSKTINTGPPSIAHLQSVIDTGYGIQHADSIQSGYLGYVGVVALQQPTTYIATNDDSQVANIGKCYNDGYNKAVGPGSEFNKGVTIYPFAPVLSIQNGKFIRNEAPIGYIPKDPTKFKDQCVTKKTFIVPILSTILGTLIPQDQWKLIPGNGLGELMFELRFNRYAFFASGHKLTWLDAKTPANGFGDLSLAGGIIPNMSQYCHEVKWKISKVAMHFDLWDFGDVVREQIDQVLKGEGILLNGQGFSIGPTNTVQNTQAVNNNWQITNGILSLKSIWIWFLSNQYQQYSFCRKNFKLSHNIKELQLKIGQSYVPMYPIRGNSGNLYKTSYWNETYLEFWMELLRNQGVFFDCDRTINISPEQFVVNERPYNPQNFFHTFGSQPLFHENRCRGQAVYTIDMQSDRNDNQVLSGMDTTQARPFELALRTNKDVKYDGDYNEPSTMYVFLHHDVIVHYKYGTVESAGWG